MQLSVTAQDGSRLSVDVDIDPHEVYPQSLAKRVHWAILQLLPHAAPSEPPPQIVSTEVN